MDDTMTVFTATLPETDPDAPRLGRKVEHDDRSWNYPAQAGPLKTVTHRRHTRIFDQGDTGSCTGQAMAGLLGTDPHYRVSMHDNEKLALKLYGLATGFDEFPGTYPPDDTGSTGLAVAKAAQSLGLIGGYTHAFGIDHALGALTLGPVIVGVNWYTSFDVPDRQGHVTITPDATVRGGHEVELYGLDVEKQYVAAANSWGTGWGLHGRFTLSFADLDRLLREQGDCTTVA